MLYPWQEEDFTQLTKIADNGFSAILLNGRVGIGADSLVTEYVKFLLCESPQALNDKSVRSSCGTCQSCRLLELGNSPDYYYLNVAEEQKAISVADVRLMINFLALSPNLAAFKVVVIPELTLLNQSSANALLKIVEEPPAYVRFVFFTANISFVLATLKSRCLAYTLKLPDPKTALDYLSIGDVPTTKSKFWLNYYDNSPLFTLEVTDEQLELFVTTLNTPSIDNIFLNVTEFDGKKISFGMILDLLAKWLYDLASIKLGGQARYFGQHYSIECQTSMNNLVNKISRISEVFSLNDQVNFLSSWATHPLNYKLQLENLLFQYQKLFMANKD